jgi:hypothetical protein
MGCLLNHLPTTSWWLRNSGTCGRDNRTRHRERSEAIQGGLHRPGSLRRFAPGNDESLF